MFYHLIFLSKTQNKLNVITLSVPHSNINVHQVISSQSSCQVTSLKVTSDLTLETTIDLMLDVTNDLMLDFTYVSHSNSKCEYARK